jgi:hypothetical protein
MSVSLPLGGAFPIERLTQLIAQQGDGMVILTLTADPTTTATLGEEGQGGKYNGKLYLHLTAGNDTSWLNLTDLKPLLQVDPSAIVLRRVDLIEVATFAALGAGESIEDVEFGPEFVNARLVGCSATMLDAFTAPGLSAASLSIGDGDASHTGSVVRAFDGMAQGNGGEHGMVARNRAIAQLQFSLALTGATFADLTAGKVEVVTLWTRPTS